MTRPFGGSDFFAGAYPGPAVFENSPSLGRSRIFLVAIQGDIFPPVFHERGPLQRMRVMLIPTNRVHEADLSDPLAEGFTALPPVRPLALPVPGDNRPQLRPVQGEVLRDEAGRLYEKIGRQIRPLHKLVSGPHGEVLDAIPSGETKGTSAGWPIMESQELAGGAPSAESYEREEREEFRQSRQPSGQKAVPSKPPIYRKLFPEPGLWRVIVWGDFKGMLAPQLAHPERLRDAHRLPCYVQVYEAKTALRLESLAAAILRDPRYKDLFQPLTPAMAAKLELMPFLQRQPQTPYYPQHEQGAIFPHERVFRLQLAHDPTTEGLAPGSTPPQPNSQTTETPSVPSTQRGSVANDGAPGLKTAIPERFLKPWEFQLPREEVLYDLNAAPTSGGWLAPMLRRLKGWIKGQDEFRRWQLLLSGKSLEEQLWAVRPPKGELSHPVVRDWAKRTLESAGYDSQGMLLEWEIFWRRKGL